LPTPRWTSPYDRSRRTSRPLLEEAPMVFLHHQEYLLGVSENVKGLIQFPTNLTYLKDAYIEE